MVTRLQSGELEFKIFVPAATTVEVLGSFTGWHDRPVPLQCDGSGWWVGRAAVPPGDHHFQYRIDGEAWMADFAAHGVHMNRDGRWISRLAVPRSAA